MTEMNYCKDCAHYIASWNEYAKETGVVVPGN